MSENKIEIAEDRIRREWAETGADYAWQILKFLQGKRINEISLTEVERTKTFGRSTELEKSTLRFVANQSEQRYPLNDEDRRRLRERDNFLMAYVDGTSLGHRDWVNEICGVPNAVAHAQAVDASLFPVTFPIARLFVWIWKLDSMAHERKRSKRCCEPNCFAERYNFGRCSAHFRMMARASRERLKAMTRRDRETEFQQMIVHPPRQKWEYEGREHELGGNENE